MKFRAYNRGFTLIEMLVVIAIFGIFTTILILDYNKFGERERFVNFIYDTALNARQTQVNGIAVREAGAGTGNFASAYGIHFEVSNPTSANNSYTLFIDAVEDGVSGDKIYQSGEGVQSIYLNTQYKISQICVFGAEDECSDDEGDSVDIVFLRPNPDAFIRFNGDESTEYSRAEITFTYSRNTDTLTRKLVIDSTGQISIQ